MFGVKLDEENEEGTVIEWQSKLLGGTETSRVEAV